MPVSLFGSSEAAAASATARAAAHAAARAASHAAAQAATHALTQATSQAAAVRASLLRQQQRALLLKQRRRSAFDATMHAMLAAGEDAHSATVAALAAADAVGPAPPAARRESVPEQQEDAATRGGEEDEGAGVGKGRQIAALIKEFMATGGKRILWVSTSADLRFDARRDLTDMRCPDIEVFPRAKNSLPKGNLSKLFPSGVLFVTYPLLVRKNGGADAPKGKRKAQGSKAQRASAELLEAAMRNVGGEEGGEPGPAPTPVARRTKAQALSDRFPPGSRLMQIVDWLGADDGECMIVLDECHKAKNLVHEIGSESTQTGMAVALLQMKLPNARVLYSSATGASEPRNLLYMLRLGTFRYESITDMVKDLTRSGLGALELFCIGLKANGTYLSRTLSYEKAEFIMEQVQIDHRMQVMYDRSTQFWTLLFNILKKLPKDVVKGRDGKAGRDVKKSLIWAAHQRFYRQMLIASKVPTCVAQTRKALSEGMCVVIGLQSTGEANVGQARESDGQGEAMDDLVSAPKIVLQRYITER
ncbi:MAG: hypothetical protein WDW36_007243 [Sanguina aurantia]